MTVHERISALRIIMEENGIDAYIIPSEDPHGSEYVTPHWQCRKWISGFTGSAGTVVVTKDKAALWTDFRYYIQAAEELKDSGIELFKFGMENVPSYEKWLIKTLNKEQTVGIDGKNFSVAAGDKLKCNLEKSHIQFKTDCSFIDRIWKENRPSLPNGKVFLHDDKYNGLAREDKLKQIRSTMDELGASHHILTSLEDICWLYNIRGTDIDTIPVVISYALISKSGASLFTEQDKIGEDVAKVLNKASISIFPYNEIEKKLASIDKDSVVLIDKDKTNTHLASLVPSECEIKYERNPTILLKARKNNVEVDNIRKIMEQDGAAMVRFIKWVEENIREGIHTELSLAAKLLHFRKMGADFAGESFTPIPGYRGHGAQCHYKAEEESQYTIDSDGGLFLIDSGGQYPGGSTDITRTLTLGNLTAEEKQDYTLVLKGHVSLSMAKFPAGTRGYQLDLLARMDMWKEGIDFGHGTGHGVGCYLSVHEGPQNISPKAVDVKLEPGMLISNEPGIYREGRHGIRIENLVLVKEDKKTEFGRFFDFETMTLCPYEPDLIDISLLSDDEIDWINRYNLEVLERLSPLLDDNEIK